MFRLFFFFSFLSISCLGNQSNTATTQETTNIDTIKYSFKSIKKTSQYLAGEEDVLDTAYYSIKFPHFEKKEINDIIVGGIFIDGEENEDQAAQSFIDGYNEFVEESSTKKLRYAWFKEVNTDILSISPLLISLQTFVNEYTGGAHGNHYAIISNYDLNTQKKIELAEMLLPNQFKNLTKIAEKHFRKQENLDDSASLSKDFFFEDGIFALNDNFGLTKKSLIIYYNEYEIKPYAEGPTTLEIPLNELDNILSDRGKKYIQSIN